MRTAFSIFSILFSFVAFGETLYWKGGTGNWHDPLHWSYSSGGLSCGRIPTATDDVVFDGNSFTTEDDTVLLSLPATCRDMTWTAGTAGATWSGLHEPSAVFYRFEIHGSLTMEAALNIDLGGELVFLSSQSGNTITTNFNTLPKLWFNNATGSWIVQDSLNTTSIELTRGTLNTNGQFIRIGKFLSSYYNNHPRELNIENSTIEVYQDTLCWDVSAENLAFNFDGSLIRFTGGQTVYFKGGELPYNVEFANPDSYVHPQSRTFNYAKIAGRVRFITNVFVHDLELLPGSHITTLNPLTITGDLTATGTCAAPITLKGGGFNKTSGSAVLEHIELDGFTSNGASLTALASTDLGGNTGWTIESASPTTYYWIGGAGNWKDPAKWSTTSGGDPANCIPKAKDEVVFDANSFNAPGQAVHMTSPTAIKNVTWTSGLPSPIWSGNQLLEVFGSITILDQISFEHSGALHFRAPSTGNTITTSGTEIQSAPIWFRGTGDWTLTDGFVAPNAEVQLQNGTLNTNGEHFSAARFMFGGNNIQRELNLGSSLLELISYNPWSAQSSTAVLNAGTSTIRLTLTNANDFNGGPHTYHNVEFTGSGNARLKGAGQYQHVHFHGNGSIENNAGFHDLTFSPGKVYSFNNSETNTITGLFSAVGSCDLPITMRTGTLNVQGSVVMDHVLVQDIQLTGNAATVENGVDQGGNTGITFLQPEPAALYWIGSTGNWSDGSKWSLTSGGPPAGCIPSPWTDAVFDENSFDQPGRFVTVDVPAFCANMIWSDAFAATLSGNAVMEIHRGLSLMPDLSWAFTGRLRFVSSEDETPIATGNVMLTSILEFNGSGGWLLMDELLMIGYVHIHLRSGTLNTNGQFVSTPYFISDGIAQRSLLLSNSTIEITMELSSSTFHELILLGNSFTLDAGTSTIRFTGLLPSMQTIGLTFHDIEFTAPEGTGILTSPQSTYNEVHFSGNGVLGKGTYDRLVFAPGRSYRSSTAHDQTILDEVVMQGTCAQPIHLTSIKFVKTSGIVTGEHLVMSSVNGVGGAQYIANNATDLGSNINWIINELPPATRFWVGDGGDWSDAAHWSNTSGGTSSGCVPRIHDHVIFDQNSFTGTAEVVNIDREAYCANMIWTENLPDPIMAGNFPLTISGSLNFSPDMENQFTGDLNFSSLAQNNLIYTKGNAFHSKVAFHRTGGWLLMDTFTVAAEKDLELRGGTVNTNGQHLDLWSVRASFLPINTVPKTLTLTDSHIRLRANGAAWIFPEVFNLTINAGTSTIELTGDGAGFIGNNYQYHDIEFNGGGQFVSLASGSTFNVVKILTTADYTAVAGQMNELHILRGIYLNLSVTLIGDLHVLGDMSDYALLMSGSITKAEGEVCVEKAIVRIPAQGGATFRAGTSVALGNASGWIMESCFSHAQLDHTTTTICEGGQVTFANISTGFVTGQQWEFPGGSPATSTEASPTVTYAAAGIYPVNLNVDMIDGTQILQLDELVIVNAAPEVSIEDEGTMLTASITDATYQWVDCNNNDQPIAGETAQSFAPPGNGVFAVEVVAGGCMAISDCVPFIHNGIVAYDEPQIKVRPNPNNGSFFLDLPDGWTDATITITDAMGRIISNKRAGSRSMHIHLQQAHGLYLLRIVSEEGSADRRIMIQ